jgi:hypothetical protein
MDILINITNTILVSAADLGVAYYYFDSNILDSFDDMLSFYGKNVTTTLGRRKLVSVAQSQLVEIEKFATLVLLDLMDGQSAVQYVRQEFTLTNEVLTPSAGTVFLAG